MLSLYGLSDLNPAKLHMTVPADLPASDVQAVQGFKITPHPRAILDPIEAGPIERNFIRQAITQAVDRGLITRQQIRSRQMSEPARRIFEEAPRRAA